MDFTFSDEAQEVAALTARIVNDQCTPERLQAIDRSAGDRFDETLWAALAEAGLLSLALPEKYDGAGLGLLEQLMVVVEAGRKVAPVPLATHLGCAYFLAAADHAELLARAGAGGAVFAPAVSEPNDHLPAAPVTKAVFADGWRVSGVKTLVRAATRADLLLVTASTDEGAQVFAVPTGAAGVTVEEQHTSDGDITGLVTFDNVAASSPCGTASRLGEILVTFACAEQLGVTEGALRLTAEYAKTREQFNTKIGTFQGVRHRLADGHIDVLGQRLTLWAAASSVASGSPDAASDVAIAKLWAADAGHRIAHTAVHIHGGVGIDMDGQTHRYFTAAKRHEFTFGGAGVQARRLGALLSAPR